MKLLRQSTAATVKIGPFIDSTNGYDAEGALSPSVKLSKNGGTMAAKNEGTTPSHDADGYYDCDLDATDTNTVGRLRLTVAGSSTHLAVVEDFQVIEESIYDALFAASAAGFDANQRVDVGSWLGTAVSGDSGGHPNVNVERWNGVSVTGDGDWDADVAPVVPAIGTVADLGSGATLADNNFDNLASIAALNDISVADILTTQMTEAYAAKGVAPTLAQAIFAIQQMVGDFAISGTTISVKGIDGSTEKMTFDLDSPTNPTSRVRAS